MLKIGIVTSEKRMFDASSYWRGYGAVSLIPDTRVEQLTGIGWQTIIDKDIIMFCNPVTDAALEQIKFVKAWNKPVWIDYDDDHFNVPEDNDTYEIYMNPVVQNRIKMIMSYADLMTVSSDELAIQYREYADNIHVIKNAWDLDLFPLKESRNTTKVIVWRGGRTRDNDLKTIQNAVLSLAEKYPDWTWIFIGSPRYFRNKGTNIITRPPIYFGSYFYEFNQIKPSILISPLEDNTFNRCKSNIAWIEATMAGAICIAPPVGEYTELPIFQYSNEQGFMQTLQTCFGKGSDETKDILFNDSINLIKDHYNLKTQNLKRLRLITEVI